MRWSQLRFDFDLTVVRLRFNCNSTTLRLRYGLQVLFWDAAQFSATAASGLRYWDRNDLWWAVERSSNGSREWPSNRSRIAVETSALIAQPQSLQLFGNYMYVG